MSRYLFLDEGQHMLQNSNSDSTRGKNKINDL